MAVREVAADFRKPYRYQKFISDIAGQDIRTHGDRPEVAAEVVRNWLRSADPPTQGGDVDVFWQNLRNGVEGVHFFSDEELLAVGIGPETFERPGYVRAKGVLADAEMFDAELFGLTPREAKLMDPAAAFSSSPKNQRSQRETRATAPASRTTVRLFLGRPGMATST